jgi:hypothetical protein
MVFNVLNMRWGIMSEAGPGVKLPPRIECSGENVINLTEISFTVENLIVC